MYEEEHDENDAIVLGTMTIQLMSCSHGHLMTAWAVDNPDAFSPMMALGVLESVKQEIGLATMPGVIFETDETDE